MPRSPLAALTALALVTMPACQGDALHPPESKRIPLAGSPARPPAPSGDVWEAIPPDIDWTPWHESHPWLTDVSSWYERFDRRDGRLTRRFEGAFGLGNGQAFGIIGLGDPLNTLSNAAGPTYQQSQNFFGDAALQLIVDGRGAGFDEQWAFRTRETAINGSLGRAASGVELFTTDFAPPGWPALVRILHVRNDGRQAATVSVRATQVFDDDEAFEAVGGMVLQRRGDHASWTVDLGGDAAFTVVGEGLQADLGALSPGQTRELALAFVYTQGAQQGDAEAIAASLKGIGAEALMLQTRDHWRAWLGEAARIRSPSERFDDLYEGMQVTIGVQTAASGAVSPMSRYTSAWLRDTLGPSRFFTRIGRLQGARAMLDYLYLTAAQRGAITNSVPADLDVSGVSEPSDPRGFWEAAALMPGRNPTEAPSYLPLQYAFTWRHTGDLALLSSRYEYLRRAVTGQTRTGDGLMLFSGDETFRITLAAALSTVQDPTDVAYSSNSAFAYVAALRELATLSDALGRGDAASYRAEADEVEGLTFDHYLVDGPYLSPALFFRSGDTHPEPFEDVSTKPLFFGGMDPDTEEARALVGAFVDRLMREDGTLLTPDGAAGRVENPGYTGMVPGLALYNLAKVDHPRAGDAFDALALTASPSGNWQEIQWKDHTAASVTHPPSGRGATDAAARYRPWEGGEDVDAALVYLLGAELDYPNRRLHLAPHLPAGWESLDAEGLPAGPEGSYDLALRRGDGGWAVTLTSHAPHALTVSLRLAEAGAAWPEVRVGGQPCGRCSVKTVYDEVGLLDVEGLVLQAGGTLTVAATP